MSAPSFRSCLLTALLFLMASCAGAPGPAVIQQPLPLEVDDTRCRVPFPHGKWEFVHSIQAALSGGPTVTMIGVTALDSTTGTVACALMTVEGMVLFEARYDGEIQIGRAVPPFDSTAFARGLINDIRFMFLPPEGRPVAWGRSEAGAFICRYETTDAMTVDIIIHGDRGWEIRQYDRDNRSIRSLKRDPHSPGSAEEKTPIPARLRLTASGPAEYALTLDLIEARELRK
jgi:hypothetical protein